MTEPTWTSLAPPPSAADRLRQLWEEGSHPDVAVYLAQAAPLPLAEVAAALWVDLQERWRIGDHVRVEELLERHPHVAADSELALDLIFGEYLLRENHAEPPTADEYAARFPDLAGAIRAQVGLHLALADPSGSCSIEPAGHPATAGRDVQASRWVGQNLASQSDQAARGSSGRRAPRVVGYEIFEELGRGGMGVVYRAYQLDLKRPCVLKMILVGGFAGDEAIERFRAEAATIARLGHPNIVQIHGMGEVEGKPYLELEYVNGGSLAGRLDGTPRPGPESARLVEMLAQATHAMHRVGVVHRDLKPGNILLTVDGTPKIADFGLAKALDDDSGLTGTGDILGTPSYMAPEQASGHAREAGPAVDVYALGAILYELITGRPPFRAATLLETLEQVRSTEPVAPSRLQPKLPRDLGTICLKCLAKDPNRRYATAGDLAEDLRRFLDGRPIRARAVSGAERAWRWSRRNPSIAGLAGFLAASLVLTALGASAAALRERRLRGEAELARADAETNLGVARRVVDEMYTQVAAKLDDRQGMDAYQREVFEKALAFYDHFALARSQDPQVRLEAARAAQRVGAIQDRLGHGTAAEAAFRRVVALLDPPAAGPAGQEDREELAAARTNLGALASKAGRPGAAEASYRQAVALLDAPLGQPGPQARRLLAEALDGLGGLLYQTGRRAEAGPEWDRAARILETLITSEPEAVGYRSALARNRAESAYLEADLGGWDRSEAAFRHAVTLLEELITREPGNVTFRSDLGRVLIGLSQRTRITGRVDEAEKIDLRAVALLDQLIREHPAVAEHHNSLAHAWNDLGLIAIDLRRPVEAEDAYRKSGEQWEWLVAHEPDRPDHAVGLGGLWCNLGNLVRDNGSPVDALMWYDRGQQSLALVLDRVPSHAEARRFLLSVHFSRAETLDRLGRHREALADRDACLKLATGFNRDSLQLARGATMVRLGDHAAASADAEAVAAAANRPEVLYNAACVLALAAALVPAPSIAAANGPATDGAVGEQYAARAVALLERAERLGMFRASGAIANLHTDHDLDALRNRPDFRTWVERLEQKTETSTGTH